MMDVIPRCPSSEVGAIAIPVSRSIFALVDGSRHPHQRTGRHRNLDVFGDFTLEQRQEAAVGGNHLGADRCQFGSRLQEVRQQPGAS